VDSFWVTKSEVVGLIVRALFPRFPTYVVIHQLTSQTDRRTDGRTDKETDDMRSQYRALHYSASRGKNVYRGTDSAQAESLK